MKLDFKSGEFVTALPDTGYYFTRDGWTARVLNSRSVKDPNTNIMVEGYNNRGLLLQYNGWDVEKENFIPYSENMETMGFKSFILCDD